MESSLTNDGQLARAFHRPSVIWIKTYLAPSQRNHDPRRCGNIRQGYSLKTYCQPAKLEFCQWIQIRVKARLVWPLEGRISSSQGMVAYLNEVVDLQRLTIGDSSFLDENFESRGEWRRLTKGGLEDLLLVLPSLDYVRRRWGKSLPFFIFFSYFICEKSYNRTVE